MKRAAGLDGQLAGHRLRRGSAFVAAGLACVLTVAAVTTAGGGSAGASTPLSQSAGRFLTGEAGGQNFDSIAALNGEEAAYPGDPGPNSNDLSGQLLGQKLGGPFKNVGIPFPGGVTFGAVGQYAKANADGSARGSSGLVGSNGAINVGGSGNGTFATIKLSGLPGASSLTSILGDLELTVGAVSSQADQAAFGKTTADPSAGCTSGGYQRVSGDDQAGRYQFANLRLAAKSPVLATVGRTVTGLLETLIEQFASGANKLGSLGLPVTITGLPTAQDLEDDFTISLFGGGVTASLTDGSFKINLAKILKYLGLDLNNLCPNTSIVPYIAQALADLPTAIGKVLDELSDKLATSLGKVVIKVGGVPITATQLTDLIKPVVKQLTESLSGGLNTLVAALEPALEAITKNLLDVTVNGQDESDNKFLETGVQLNLIPNGGSLPTLPAPPGLPGVPSSFQQKMNAAVAQAKADGKKPSHGRFSVAALNVRHLSVPKSKPLATAAAASDPVVQLNLASSAVTNNQAVAPTTSDSVSPTSTSTDLPTGVPAGQASDNTGAPTTPLVLVLLGVLLAGGALFGIRRRRGLHH